MTNMLNIICSTSSCLLVLFLLCTDITVFRIFCSLFYVNLIDNNKNLKGNITIFLSYFLLIAFFNIVGLIIFDLTFTATVVLPVYLSCIMLIWIYIISFIKVNRVFILYHYTPSTTPFLLLSLIFVIESLSFIARFISLPVRLFANMMAGHTSLKIFSNFLLAVIPCSIILLASSNIIVTCLAISLIFSIITFINILEIVISILQAYVFVSLLNLYTSEIQF
jgi:ATP synthase subunit 6